MSLSFEVSLGDTELREISMATGKVPTLFHWPSLEDKVEVYGSWNGWREGTALAPRSLIVNKYLLNHFILRLET